MLLAALCIGMRYGSDAGLMGFGGDVPTDARGRRGSSKGGAWETSRAEHRVWVRGSRGCNGAGWIGGCRTGRDLLVRHETLHCVS